MRLQLPRSQGEHADHRQREPHASRDADPTMSHGHSLRMDLLRGIADFPLQPAVRSEGR